LFPSLGGTASRSIKRGKGARPPILVASRIFRQVEGLRVVCKPSGAYAGAKGNDVRVALYKQSASRVKITFYDKSSPIGFTVGIGGHYAVLGTAVAATAALRDHFEVTGPSTAASLVVIDSSNDAGDSVYLTGGFG